jgi:hypothetical protein
MTLSPVWSWIHRSATTHGHYPFGRLAGVPAPKTSERNCILQQRARSPLRGCFARFAPAGAPKFWCHESGNHSPRLQDARCPHWMPKRTARVEPRHPALCLRDHGSGRSRRAAARRCRSQARHTLPSRGVVSPLPAPVPLALLRPPPFVRPRPPSDSCHTLVTETVPDYPLAGTALMGSISTARLVSFASLLCNSLLRSTALANRSRTVESACTGCNRPAGR